jgi:hypothetical protein
VWFSNTEFVLLFCVHTLELLLNPVPVLVRLHGIDLICDVWWNRLWISAAVWLLLWER